MSNSNTSQPFDLSKLYAEMDEMSSQDTIAGFRKGIEQSLNIIVNRARANLGGNASKYGKIHNAIPSKSLGNAVHSYAYKSGHGGIVMADYSKYGNPITMWLEGGARNRFVTEIKGKQLKKAANRGEINPRYFFSEAVDTSYNQVLDSVDNFIMQSLNKIHEKYN